MKVYVTDHAADRYIERVKNHYTRDQARAEVKHLCQTGQILESSEHPYLREDREYIELSDGIYAPLVSRGEEAYCVVTLMVRGALSEEARKRKNSRNQDTRYRRGLKKSWRDRQIHSDEDFSLEEWEAEDV